MKISEFLGQWLTIVGGGDGSRKKERLWMRLWIGLHGSAVGMTICLSLMSVTLAGAFLTADSMYDMNSSLLVSVCTYSGFAGQVFFRHSRERARGAIASLRVLAGELEASARPGVLLEMVQTGQKARRWLFWIRPYTALSSASIAVPCILSGKPSVPMWPQPDSQVFLYLLAALDATSAMFGTVSFYEFFVLLISVNMCSVSLYTALGAELEEAFSSSGSRRSSEHIKQIVARHIRLTSASRALDDTLSGYLIHTITLPLIATALATCNFVYGVPNELAMVVVPLVFIIFVPVCLTGEDLEQASSVALSYTMYSTPWFELPLDSRKTCLLVMKRAALPQSVSIQSFAKANRRTCFDALKTWFKYVQMLINFR